MEKWQYLTITEGDILRQLTIKATDPLDLSSITNQFPQVRVAEDEGWDKFGVYCYKVKPSSGPVGWRIMQELCRQGWEPIGGYATENNSIRRDFRKPTGE